jgi:hypothetical protein
MHKSPPAGVLLVLLIALFLPIVACSRVSNISASLPVDSATSSSAPIAPSGLQLGYLWQKDSQNLYPVVGVTGSARLGDGVLPANERVTVAGAAKGPTGAWAVVLDQDGTLKELNLSTGAANPLAAHIPLDSTLVFSPAGVTAALGSASAHSVVVLTGLPSAPRVSTLMLPSGVLSGVAVSDGGTVIAGISQPGAAGTQVTMISEMNQTIALGSVQGWGGAAFVPAALTGSGGEAAVFADSGSARVSYAANLGAASPDVRVLAGSGLLRAPNAVGVSANGKWAFVSDGGKPQVVRLSLIEPASAPSAIACACNPDRLSPETTDGIYALTSGSSGQPSWLLDTRTSQPRTFFVPASTSPSAAATGKVPRASVPVRSGGSR